MVGLDPERDMVESLNVLAGNRSEARFVNCTSDGAQRVSSKFYGSTRI